MVKAILAGFNIDKEGLNEIERILEHHELSEDEIPTAYALLTQAKENKEKAIAALHKLTPETISASYARISRDSRPIPELRTDARQDIEASRKSNKAIIFAMGHKSIAEHAVFNYDILGLSRKGVEKVEKKRLDSFTERSQRYVTLAGDYVVPEEIRGTPWETLFRQQVERSNAFYGNHLDKLIAWHNEQDYLELFQSMNCADKPERQKIILEGLGKEDARYPLPLATEAQLGMTVSARNLEVLITMLRSSDVAEDRDLGEQLHREVDGIAPSVIKYTKPTDYFAKTRKELQVVVDALVARYDEPTHRIRATEDDTGLTRSFTSVDRDSSIIAGLIFSSSRLCYGNCLSIVKKMSNEEKFIVLDQADKYQEVHDPKLREYELGDRVIEIEMSSSAYAQMKRHRMNTLIPQDYDVQLGFTMPKSVKATGATEEFREIMQRANLLSADLEREFSPDIADYIKTNAHRRRVLLDANNRQAHAICCERLNLAAQWDIRSLITKYKDLMQRESPLTLRKLCGKHEFNEVYNKVQGV